jgi:O-antigen/teichoic acid export membrane protein
LSSAQAVSSRTAAKIPADAARAEQPSRVGRNASVLAGGQAVTWTMTLLWTIVVPRALGPEGMGVLVTAMSVTGVFSILLGLGTRNYLVREIVVRPDAASRLVGTGIILRLALAPLFAASIIAYASVANYGHDETIVLYLAGAAAFLTLLAEPMQAGFQAIERMKYLAYSDVINKSSQGLLGIAIVLLGFRVVGLTASWVVIAAVVVVLDAVWLSRHVRIDFRTNAHRLADMARQSVAYWAFGLFFMIYLWIDSVMLSLLTKPEVVGWYGVPTKLFQTLMFLPALLGTAWLPRLVSAFQSGPDRLKEAARTPIELVLVLSAPICAGTAILAGPLIHVLYGSAYDNAVPVMIILGLCIPPMYLNIMLSQVLIAAKRQLSWTWVMAGATVINPLFNLALIPMTQNRYGNGAIGASLSLLFTELFVVCAGFVLVGRDVLDLKAVKRCLAVAVVSAAAWGVAYSARPLGQLQAIALAAVSFVVLAAAFRVVTAEERELLRTGFVRIARRA